MTGRRDVVEWHGAVPAIPASRVDPVVEDDAVLMWVRHGTLTVDVDGVDALVATAGEAVWVPPGRPHSARLEAGAVAVPMIVEVHDVPPSLSQACVVAIPPGWSSWLLHRVASWFGFTSGAPTDRTHLIDLLTEVVPTGRTPEVPALPPLPRSPGPRAIVDRLRRDPATPKGLAELAADAMISPRTLQRQLREETGHGLAQWRTAIRVSAGATHLAQGRDLGWTAHRVGYASVSSFSHAFADRVGTSPGRFAARYARGVRRDDPLVDELVTLVAPCAEALEPPDIPAIPPASWVTPFDSVVWVHSGSVTVGLAGRRWRLEAGDVVWLPHGLPHLMEIAEGSVVLPLGWRPAGRPVRQGSVHVVRMPDTPEVERFLLHAMVANHFLLRPPGHDDQAVLELLRPSSTTVPDHMPRHLEMVVSAVVDDPSDRRNLAEWAAELAVDPASLRQDFADVMGESFPRWRAKVRMTEARALMWDGHAPSAVARRLGYSHLPAFSKAFSASHGMPPREWLRREAG